MAPILEPGVPVASTDLLGDASAGPDGPRPLLGGQGRQLDADLVRLAPGAESTVPAEGDLDVLLYVVAGGGRLGSGQRDLGPGSLVWLPRGAEHLVRAGADGLVHLTVRRRPGPVIRAFAVETEGGEPACALHRVCQECGRLAAESDARFCGRCGTPLSTY